MCRRVPKPVTRLDQWSVVVAVLSLCTALSFVHGSHLIKYHISDYCDGTVEQQRPLQLTPNTNMTAIQVKLKREAYRPNIECTIRLVAPANYGLMAFVTKLKLRRFAANQADRLEFVSNNITLLRMHGLNQEVVPRKTILTGLQMNQLDIHFTSENVYKSLAGKGFTVVVNLYNNVLQNNQCDANLGLDFNCGNDICIDSLLECDGINNCRNNEDELECDETSETKLSLYVFLVTIVVMVVLVMMFMMKNKDKRKEIVRRMSRVYANNNPILYVMEGNGDTDSQTNQLTDSSLKDFGSGSVVSANGKQEHYLQSLQQTQLHPNPQRTIHPVRSKLSLSLPQGIDSLHINGISRNNHI